MPTYSSYTPLGTSIETAELASGAVTADKLGTGWILHASGSWATTSSLLDETSLPAKKAWLLVLNMTGGTGNYVFIQFNGDTGNNYAWMKIDTTQTTTNSSQQKIYAGFTQDNTDLIYISGGNVAEHRTRHLSGTEGILLPSGKWTATSAQEIDQITITSDGSNTNGDYALYYLEDL